MPEWFGGVLDWLQEWPKRILTWLLDKFADLITAIPVPDFMQNLSGALNALPPGFVWWLDFFEIPAGFGMCMGALLLRFAIRRLPVVG